MAIHELSDAEFDATFTPPMRRLGLEEMPPVRFNVKEYLAEVIGSIASTFSTACDSSHAGELARVTHDGGPNGCTISWNTGSDSSFAA